MGRSLWCINHDFCTARTRGSTTFCEVGIENEFLRSAFGMFGGASLTGLPPCHSTVIWRYHGVLVRPDLVS